MLKGKKNTSLSLIGSQVTQSHSLQSAQTKLGQPGKIELENIVVCLQKITHETCRP